MTRKALVVDDEVDLTVYLSSILQENGFDVRCANDARSAEDLIEDDPPDLVLLDLMMPGRTGIQLFTRLRGKKETAGIPIVMVTGIKDQTGIDWGAIVDRFKVRRPDGFVEKPIDPDCLMRVIGDVLHGPANREGVVHG